MPEQVEECVESVLEDNTDYSESRAWAICKAQHESSVDRDAVDVEQLADVEFEAAELDELASTAPTWTRHKSELGVAWIDTETGLAVFDGVEAQQDSTGFAVDVFEIVQEGEEGPVADGALLGVGADMPNAGVYVDWNIDAWPDDEQLAEPHVSDYGSIEDLEQATGGTVRVIETVAPAGGGDEGSGGVDQQADLDTPRKQLVVQQELSQEERTTLREAIERRHNVTVTEVAHE
jgi:hypothetical protein